MDGGKDESLILAHVLLLLGSPLVHFLYIKRTVSHVIFYYYKYVTLHHVVLTKWTLPTYFCLPPSLLSTMSFCVFSASLCIP